MRVLSSIQRWLHLHTIFLLLLLSICTNCGQDFIVWTKVGKVRGKRYHLRGIDKPVDAYLGIPFAKPPLGPLRFKPPIPIDRFKGVYNATRLPNSCYQQPDLAFDDFYGATMWNANTKVSEDCLYLNVWVPKSAKKHRKAAVLFWIFGGGFYYGSSTLALYDGKYIAALNDIIVVSPNYRLGPFGFLYLNHPEAPGNAGMYDQLMALNWVQSNIRYFGGDPRNVTIFGESAGSVSVSLHLLSPLSRTKFARAILQSGSANMPWATLSAKEAVRRSKELAIDYLHCRKTDDMGELIECLRSIPAERLSEQQFIARGIMQFPFVPSVDGVFISEDPVMSLSRGSFKKCPILLGSNKNEGAFFVIYEVESLNLTHTSMNKRQFIESITNMFLYYPQFPQTINSIALDAITFQYSSFLDPEDTSENLINLDNAIGDSQFVCHVNSFANYYARAAQPVYSYYFTQRYHTNPWPEWMGVLHGDEILYLFGEPMRREKDFTSRDRLLAKKMMKYWTNFAKLGDPNLEPGRHSLDEWPLYNLERKEYLELNTKFLHNPDKSQAVGRGPRTKECAFWKSYLPKLMSATARGEDPTRKPESCPNGQTPTIGSIASLGVSLVASDWLFILYILSTVGLVVPLL